MFAERALSLTKGAKTRCLPRCKQFAKKAWLEKFNDPKKEKKKPKKKNLKGFFSVGSCRPPQELNLRPRNLSTPAVGSKSDVITIMAC
jgi:hypothetical protein